MAERPETLYREALERKTMTQVNLRGKDTLELLTRGKPKLLRLAVVERTKSGCIPHISSVWYLWRNGSFWITTSADRLKVKAIRKNSRVALIVDTDVIPYQGVIVEGTATLTKKQVKEITLEIVKRYLPERSAKKQFDDLMKYPRVLIRVRPDKVLGIMSYKIH